MRAALVAGAVLVAGGVVRAGDDAGARASVEAVADRTTVYVGEPVRLRLVASYDAAFFDAQAVPLFSRRTDVPVQVLAPWLRAIPGMESVAPREPAVAVDGPRASIAVGDDVVPAVRDIGRLPDGRPCTTLTVERAFVAREPGEVTLGAPELRFAYATRFEDDFVNGRRGVDRHDVRVAGRPVTLHVLALPEQGRPASFGGAVGRSLAIRAESPAREVTAGETFRVTLRVDGDGHLATFDAPRLDALAGFHVYGVLDDRGAARRTIDYDVAALDAPVREFPAVEWAYFDTGDPPSYRVLRTEAIPLTVHPATDSKHAASPPQPEEGVSPWIWAALAVTGAAFVAAIAWIASRRGSRAEPDPAGARRAAAAEAVRAAAGKGDAAAAYTEYLATSLQCATAAVVSPDLAGRLAAAGVPGDLAARAAAALDALVASRYGGGGAPTAGELATIVAEMEAACPLP